MVRKSCTIQRTTVNVCLFTQIFWGVNSIDAYIQCQGMAIVSNKKIRLWKLPQNLLSSVSSLTIAQGCCDSKGFKKLSLWI